MSKFPKPVIVDMFLLAKLVVGEQGITSFSVKFLSEGRQLHHSWKGPAIDLFVVVVFSIAHPILI